MPTTLKIERGKINKPKQWLCFLLRHKPGPWHIEEVTAISIGPAPGGGMSSDLQINRKHRLCSRCNVVTERWQR